MRQQERVSDTIFTVRDLTFAYDSGAKPALEEVASHVDRIVYLYDGKVRRDCDPKTFFNLVLSGRLAERAVFVPQPAELAYVLSRTDQGLRDRLPLDNGGFVRWWKAGAGAGS